MDKYEYKLKLEQMQNLAAQKEYKTAAQIADSINWKKVKSVSTLCTVGEIYEHTKQYDESREILLMAYDRSPVGRNIIYRLTLVAVKLNSFEEAEEYYEEFLEIAPHDNMKYVLRYEIAKGKGAGIGELIAILEEFKEREYTEEWAFELAYLYHKEGDGDKCVEICDELILWFGEGRYVEKALELKMLYQPLNKLQEDKYRRFKQKRDGFVEVHPTDALASGEIVSEAMQIPNITPSVGRFNTLNLQAELAMSMEQIMNATEQETVSDTMDSIKKMVEEIPYLKVGTKEAERGEEADGHQENEEDGSLRIDFNDIMEDEYEEPEVIQEPEEPALLKQITGKMSIEEVLNEWERTKQAAEKAMAAVEQKKLETAKARALHEAEGIMGRLTDLIPKLEAGLTPQDLMAQHYLQDDEYEGFGSRLYFDPETGEPLKQFSETQEEFVEVPVEVAAREWMKQITRPIPNSPLDGQTRPMPDIMELNPSLPEEEFPEYETTEEYTVKEEEADSEEQQLEISEYGTSAEAGMTGEEPLTGEISDYRTFLEDEEDEEERTPGYGTPLEDSREDEDYIQGGEMAEEYMTGGEAMPEITTPEQLLSEEEPLPEISMPKEYMAAEEQLPEISMPEIEGTDFVEAALEKSAREAAPITRLSEDQRKVFSYFMHVSGMEQQLCQVLQGVQQRKSNSQTSASGNIVIIGGRGNGKTNLATDMIKVIQKMRGKGSGKVGKITAAMLNQKDISKLLKAVEGGYLIIEKAGALSRDAVIRLSLLLEGDTKGLLVILEDNRSGIEKVLARDADFAKKFTEKVKIPIFTSDELVSFARAYAKEQECEIDDMGILALYNSISNIQKVDEATTLVEVKEIMDETIERARKGGLKKLFGGKRYTEDGLVLLKEKDFE